MRKWMVLLAVLFLSLTLVQNCFAKRAELDGFEARVEIIRETLPTLEGENLSWLGGQISWDYRYLEPYQEGQKGAEFSYRVRVRIYGPTPNDGTVTFGSEQIDLDTDESYARTYYPKNYYSYNDFIQMFDGMNVTFDFTDGTKNYQDQITIDFPSTEEELFDFEDVTGAVELPPEKRNKKRRNKNRNTRCGGQRGAMAPGRRRPDPQCLYDGGRILRTRQTGHRLCSGRRRRCLRFRPAQSDEPRQQDAGTGH